MYRVLIKIKLLGGAKKSIARDEIPYDQDNATIRDVLNFLQKIKPKDTPALDLKNILIAINGIDSSALDGEDTILKKNDVISIIPVIHGGSRLEMVVSKTNVEVVEIDGRKATKQFLDVIRKDFPNLSIQAIHPNFVLNESHLYKILKVSIESQCSDNLVANRLETDILLRFTGTTQISQAINKAGIKTNENFLLIALGKKTDLNKFYKSTSDKAVKPTLPNNSRFVQREFNITKTQIETVDSKYPLEDLLAEKAAVLFQ